jgi:tRNA uridine 5-carboxymethylaminomethyl modification enzyme
MLDVLVIGGGHAGLEAAAAAARVEARTALVTLDRAAPGRLSCNPAIGGVGKGHLVREIDALGGLMGRLADRTGIQFRLLNTSRGPAVRGPRAQVDRNRYPAAAQEEFGCLPVELLEDEVTGLIVEDGRCLGAELAAAGPLRARAVVLASGTFLGGILHCGEEAVAGGRRGESAAFTLSQNLQEAGIPLGRFKTGTPPRLRRDSIDWSRTSEQLGDEAPTFFSPETRETLLPQAACHETHTTPEAHAVIRDNLERSPMMAGRITGRGPRYCPSFEEKVVRFADRDRHQLLLEPEALDSDLIYLNGASTSLPAETQTAFLRLVPALEEAEVAQFGYAVEYDYLLPGEVRPNLETRRLPGLFVAGQALGTTGYEEAAGLGLVAGANAALAAQERPSWVLGRHEGYLGVLVDDLVTRALDEPYRMFTSRAEHRLLLGIDSADLRLAARGAEIGLVSSEVAERASERRKRLEAARELLGSLPAEPGRSLADTCRRPETRLGELLDRVPEEHHASLGEDERERRRTLLEAGQALRYATYLERQQRAAERLERGRQRPIPTGFRFRDLPGLSREVQEGLERTRPLTLDQASRLPGMTPAALQVLDAHLARAARNVPRGTEPS